MVGLDVYYEAFDDLSTCRQLGMGVGPIPFTAALEYCRLRELSGEDQERFLFLMRRMDAAYLEYHKAKSAGRG